MTKSDALQEQFKNAYRSFIDALELESSATNEKSRLAYRDSIVQRFEFTVDLSWKVLKEILEQRFGVTALGPKPIIREAFKKQLISDDVFWLRIIDMRNESSHTYDQSQIEQMLTAMPQVRMKFEELLKIIA